jgi:hypothetical protein
MQCFGIERVSDGYARCASWNPLMQFAGISAHFCFKHVATMEPRLDRETRRTLDDIRKQHVFDALKCMELETELWRTWCRSVTTEDAAQMRALELRVKRMREQVELKEDVEAMRASTGWCKSGVTVSALARHDSTCPVCLENVHRSGNPCMVLSCSHKLCYACALKHNSNKCVTCRALVTHGLAAYA